MPIRRVPPKEAAELVESGWTYVDVRTVPEFEAGHPRGAFNVPLLQDGKAGRVSNPDFLGVMELSFPNDTRILVGCQSGKRSMRAAEILTEAGFENVVDVQGGYGGDSDSMGRVVVPGWSASGLPVATAAEPGRRYEDLKEKAARGEAP